MGPEVDAATVTRVLRAGVATLDALASRLGGADRDALLWALEDAESRGWVRTNLEVDCGPDGICGASAPTVYTATDAGRSAVRAAG